METATYPISYALRLCGGATTTANTTITHSTSTTAKLPHHVYAKRLCSSNSLLASPTICHFYSFTSKFNKRLQSDRFIGSASLQDTPESNPSQKFALLLEVERSVIFSFPFLSFSYFALRLLQFFVLTFFSI